MSKPIPGPYAADSFRDQTGRRWCVRRAIDNGERFRSIADMRLGTEPVERATATLLAAAPDMLKTLEAVRRDALARAAQIQPGRLLEIQTAINRAKREAE